MSDLRLSTVAGDRGNNNNNNNNINGSEHDLILTKGSQVKQALGNGSPTGSSSRQFGASQPLSHHLSHQQLGSAAHLQTSPSRARHQMIPESQFHQQPMKAASKSASHQHLQQQQQQQQGNNDGTTAANYNQFYPHHHHLSQTTLQNSNNGAFEQPPLGATKTSSQSAGLIIAAAAQSARQQQQVVIDRSDSASLPSSGSASTSDSMFKRRRLSGSSGWSRFLAACCCSKTGISDSMPPPSNGDSSPLPDGPGHAGKRKGRARRGLTLTPLGLLFALMALVALIALLLHFKLFGLSLTCALLGGSGNAAQKQTDGFNMKNGAEFYMGITEMLQAMDNTVDPCHDFYNYACGAWTRRHSIPGDESRIDTFSVMRTDLGNKLRDLLEEEVDASDSEASVKAKTLYRSCINESLIDRRGAEPLVRLLNEHFGGWPLLGESSAPSGSDGSSTELQFNDTNSINSDWVRLMAVLRTYNNEIIIGQTVGSHEQNSSLHAIRLYPAGLGLPSADYYNASSRQFKAYENYITATAHLLKANNSNLMADIRDLLEFESGLANISKPFERAGGATYHRMSIARLQKYTPAINWDTYFKYAFPDIQINASEQVGLYGLDFFMDIAHLINTTPSKKTVINYLLWRFVMNRVNNLGKQFADNQHEYAAEISGAKQQAPRHKVCVDYVNSNMGMAVSALYVKRHFDTGSKAQAETMIANIRQAFLDILNQVDWMDMETRQEAIVKAKSMLQHIGFPLWIINNSELDAEYQHLSFSPESYFENVIQLIQAFAKESRLKLRQPSERDKWTVAPSIINAHYLRTKNLMSFPAGILQPPIYHTRYPKSLNYGGIGSIIGHEITHGFDNDGRHHDYQGNQRLWWHPNTIDRFIVRSQCMVRQYDDYNVEIRGENITVSGIRTLGENIADNGGLKEAFMAYQKYEQENGPEDLLPGLNLTHHQMFFIKFAQNWCQNMTPQSMMNALKTWRHPLGRFRVIGTLSNLNEFSQAFKCPANSQMNPANKCKVW